MADASGANDAMAVSWDQVHAFRVARHHLDRPVAKARIAEAVADACGIQAQVMAAAQLALRARVRGLTVEDVGRALWEDRSISRVWCMRGTVHLVPSKELAVFVRGSSTRQNARVANYFRRTGVPEADAERLLEAGAAAMDHPRSRGEIAERIGRTLGWPLENGGSRGWGSPSDAAGFRLGRWVITIPDLAFIASYRGLACFGPDGKAGSTFVRPDAWIRGWRDLSVEDAEDALLRRYLRAFGPATVHDFAVWSTLAVARAREIWSRVAGELAPVSLGGRVAWVLRRDRAALQRARFAGPTVRLLPYFDSYLLGHKERRHLVDAAHHKRIYRPAGWVYPAVLVDGRVAGEWSYVRKRERLLVRVRPYAAIEPGAQDLVRAEAEDVARFMGAADARTTFAKSRGRAPTRTSGPA